MREMTMSGEVLRGSRVHLRPFDIKTDAAYIFSICSKEETVRFYGMEPMKSVAEAERLLSAYASGTAAGTSLHWAITDAVTDKVIGDAGIMSIDANNYRASSYCILDAQYWGMGLSYDAMKMLFDYVFSTTNLNRIHAYVDKRNKRTIKSVQGIGFVLEGILREYEFDKGEFIDDAVFSLTRSDWCKIRHAVFGARERQARQKFSWQYYEFGDEHYVWIFDGEKQRYHLLTGLDADRWLKAENPMILLCDEGFSTNDEQVIQFLSRLRVEDIVYEVHWDVTNACNSKCKHCYNYGAHNGSRDCVEGDMSDDECRDLLKAMREKGVFRIVFSGGEPLIRKGFLELVREARELGFQVVIYTNGILVDEVIADQIAKLCPVSVGVSAYGASAATHDEVTGIYGSFEKSMNALCLLSERGVHTVMKCVVLHSNFKEIAAMRTLGLQIAENVYFNYIFYPSLDNAVEMNEQMLRMSEIVTLALEPESEIYFGKQSHQLCRYEPNRDYVCTQVQRSLYLNSRGQVFPCIAVPCAAGNWRGFFTRAKRCADDAILSYWRKLRFSDIPLCGKHDYCLFCYSACSGDGLLVNRDEHLPPTNHCRLAIGRYVASRLKVIHHNSEEIAVLQLNDSVLVDYMSSLGISRDEYEVRGIL